MGSNQVLHREVNHGIPGISEEFSSNNEVYEDAKLPLQDAKVGSKPVMSRAEGERFLDFLFRNKRNKLTLRLAIIATVAQFIIFKYIYPFPNFIYGDSFNYIESAITNWDINTYLVGYARFLRLVSVFTKSDFAIVVIQYLLIQSSALLIIFTIFYFYRPGKVTQLILLCFLVFNPLFLHMSNLISSDGLFLALSLVWFALLLWIIHEPSFSLLILHAIVIFLCFTIRYNALIYPGISCLALLMSKYSLKSKIVSMGFGVLMIALFILNTGSEYKKLTGRWQYSPFAGWQWANNAMYAYRYVTKNHRKPVPQRFKLLDQMIRTYFDSTRDTKKHPEETWMASTAYMWTPGMPLQKYADLQFSKDSVVDAKKRWSTMGPFYKDYGTWIIRRYPFEFARYFLWPNANKYFAPPVEFLRSFNDGKDSVPAIAQLWFNYPDGKIKIRTASPKVKVLDFYPIFSGVINFAMLCSLFFFAMLEGFRRESLLKKGVLLAGTVWIVNALFTISASSAALRFQSFPILLATIFSIVIIDWMCRFDEKRAHETAND